LFQKGTGLAAENAVLADQTAEPKQFQSEGITGIPGILLKIPFVVERADEAERRAHAQIKTIGDLRNTEFRGGAFKQLQDAQRSGYGLYDSTF
jgi:hypothetical protein